ncbi:MAG TPA: NADH-quinone oxidoreductase subunit J [Minicystis sp.]|nr:NADH-quinone oxidoreductase subunit J [Minicystis sp.]
MITLEFVFFAICALLLVVGGIVTVAARNPIRGALGLLTTILGTAGMYLLLSAEFLAAIQVLVYAGAVVVLFLFVIMLLGPSATSARDARTALPRYLGAGVFLAAALAAALLVGQLSSGASTAFAPPPPGLGSIEGIGRELFTTHLVPFELSGALLLVAVVGAVAVARGRQPDPTLLPASDPESKAYAGQHPLHAHATKEAHK